MTRQLYAFIAAIYTSSNKMMLNVNNQNESNEMVSMDDIELITAAPDPRLPNRFKIRVREGREFIEPWKTWLNPSPVRTAPTVRKAVNVDEHKVGPTLHEENGIKYLRLPDDEKHYTIPSQMSPEEFAAELMRDRTQNQE